MVFIRLALVGILALGLSNCRKKSETAESEIREAGYEMTSEGWFSAVRGNDVSVMRKMVDGGFDAKSKDTEGNGSLHVAASSGSKEAGEYLLNGGLSIDEKGAGGRTPLMAAVIADKPAMVKWLLRQGADPKLKDDGGFMALMLAVSEGRKACVEELAAYHREDLDSALLLASLVGKAEVIDALTNYGASVYARMEDGRTPLMLAAQNGHKEAAAMLIDIGASRFTTTESGETAQSMAVAAGHTELAELIEKGFSGGELALESDQEVAEALGEYMEEFQEPDEPSAEGGELADVEGGNEVTPWNKPIAGQGDESSGALVGAAVGGIIGEQNPDRPTRRRTAPPVASLEGARIGRAEAAPAERAAATPTQQEDPPLVMRHYRQRELPVEVKRVSGGRAVLHLSGTPSAGDVEVEAGATIPGSGLSVVRVFTRTEQGKLNDGNPIDLGVVEVEDKASGNRAEWVQGFPASGHDPVALVEDASTGRLYAAKPGQRFSSEDGRVFIVNDVRPGQLVIEDTASGEVRTLPLRGPKG